MKPLTREWLIKAEKDFKTAGILLRIKRTRNDDDICFHCQQCVEKHLKAYLVELGLDFPKTHDLRALLALILPSVPDWADMRSAMHLLSDYAIAFRYPGETATHDEANEAYAACILIRKRIRHSFRMKQSRL